MKGTSVAAVTVIISIFSLKAAGAQSVTPVTPVTPENARGDSVYAAWQVDRRARAIDSLRAPAVYPPLLLEAHVSGRVVASFVVDTMGVADMSTFTVDSSSSDEPLFVESAQRAVAASRYVPAELQGHRVRQIVEQPFTFAVTEATTALEGDHAAELLPDSPLATYPTELRKSGIEGIVLAEFAVDTAGMADSTTFRIVEVTLFQRVDLGKVNTNEAQQRAAFEESVRAVLPKLRFVPSVSGGQRVRQMVKMPFTFTIDW